MNRWELREDDMEGVRVRRKIVRTLGGNREVLVGGLCR